MCTASHAPPATPNEMVPLPAPFGSTGLLDLVSDNRRLLATGVTWQEFEQFLAWRDERQQPVRFTFSQGNLEFVRDSNTRSCLELLDFVIAGWFEETAGDYATRGELTRRRSDLMWGLVPENFYYIGTAAMSSGLRSAGMNREFPTLQGLPTLPHAELPRFLSMETNATVSCAIIGRRFRESVPASRPAPPPG